MHFHKMQSQFFWLMWVKNTLAIIDFTWKEYQEYQYIGILELINGFSLRPRNGENLLSSHMSEQTYK